MPTEGPSDADEAAALLGGLTSAEIRRVIFAPRYCPRLESGFDSVGYFVRMRNRVFRSVKSSVPRGIAATLAAEVVMYPGCFNDPEITRLAFGIPRCMICSLPFPIYNDEIFKDINKLVYRIGIIPIFAEFNRYLLFYPEDIISDPFRVGCALRQKYSRKSEKAAVYRKINFHTGCRSI